MSPPVPTKSPARAADAASAAATASSGSGGSAPPETGKLLARAVAVGVVLIAMFVFFFVTPSHDPAPNGLPIAVAGHSAASDSLASRLESQDFKVVRVADADAAGKKIEDRDAYGAFVGGPGSQRVLVSTAASVPVAQTLQGVATAADVRNVEDVKPIDPDDPRGVTLNVFVLALVVSSIVSALVAVQMVPRLRALGPRVAASAAVALLGAMVAVGIVKAEGALPGSFLAEVGIVSFAILAIAISSAGLIRLIGPGGAIAPFLILLMLGNPASGLASAPEMLPTPWYPLGMFFPPGALGSALRGAAYFDGAEVLGPMLVLAAYVVVGLGLNGFASRRQTRSAGAKPAQPEPTSAAKAKEGARNSVVAPRRAAQRRANRSPENGRPHTRPAVSSGR